MHEIQIPDEEGWIKKALYSLKFNTCTCRHYKREVITTYYSNPKPKYKNRIELGPRKSIINLQTSIRPKIRRIAALGLGFGLLC